MITNGLSDFIKLERSKRIPDEEIRASLIKNNWSINDVDRAFDSLKDTPVTPPSPIISTPPEPAATVAMANHRGRNMLVVIFVLLILGGAIYYAKKTFIVKNTTIGQTAGTATTLQQQNSPIIPPVQDTTVANPPISTLPVTSTPTTASTPTVKAGQQGISLGKFFIPNPGLVTNLYFSFYGTATQDGFSKFYLYVNNHLIDTSYLDSSNYKPGVGPMTIASVQFGNEQGIFTGPQTVELRTDLSPTVLSSTIGAKVSKLYMSGNSNSIPVQGIVGKEITIVGRTIILTTTDDPIPRIAMDAGYVNQHVDIAKKIWVIDPDNTSGFDLDPLTYCKKWYPNTVSVKPYRTETLNNGRVGASGEMNSEATNTITTTQCIQPSSQ